MTQPSPTTTPSALNAPDRLYVLVKGAGARETFAMAQLAVRHAQANAPKLTGKSAQRLQPFYGPGFFGVRWLDPWVWFQEAGTRPRVMKNLAGKVIPMWIDDPTGAERTKNPKAKTRVTESGKQQVLIFRKVGKIGERKSVRRKVGGTYRMVSVPSSYPGAPGRIAKRRYDDYPGSHTGKIASGNSGLRWYNPGLHAKGFIENSLLTVAQSSGYGTPEVQKA